MGSTVPYDLSETTARFLPRELDIYRALVGDKQAANGLETVYRCRKCGMKGRPRKFHRLNNTEPLCPRCQTYGTLQKTTYSPILMHKDLTDIRSQTIKLLRFLKDAIPQAEPTLFTVDFLVTTFRLFGFDRSLLDELLTYGLLKQTALTNGEEPGTMRLTWSAKGTVDETFDHLVLMRRKIHDELEKEKLKRPATLEDVHNIMTARFKDLQELISSCNREVTAREKELKQREELIQSLEVMRKGLTGLTQTVAHQEKSLKELFGILESITASREAVTPRVDELEKLVAQLRTTPLGTGVEDFMDMVTNDLHGTTVHLKNVEDNVRMLMASFRQEYKEVPVKNPNLARKLNVAFIGPYERDWSHVTERLDKNIIPHRLEFTGEHMRPTLNFDYVILAKACVPCYPQWKTSYGDRAILVPSNGLSRLVATANALT